MIPLFILTIENNDDRAFIEHIYREYYNLMYKKTLDILENRDCVDDIINETCIKLISKIHKLREFNCYVLTSYIVYTIRSVAIDYCRKENISSKWISLNIDEETENEIPDTSESLDELIIKKDEMEKLHHALEKLPEKYRTILQLKYFCEMDNNEISKVFDIEPQNIRMYILRAKNMLRKNLNEEPSLYGIK